MIYFNSDDYGVSIDQSKQIYDCFAHGVLNSVSIIPNSPQLEPCYRLIKEAVDSGKIRCVVHLNFLEGKCCAPAKDIPDLVDEREMLNCSFISVLKANYSRRRAAIKAQLKLEIAAQIKAVMSLCGGKKVNVDSHQHLHMIPVVWEALMDVIEEEGYELGELRIPIDPISIFLTSPNVWKDIHIINLIKWGLLKFLCPGGKERNRSKAEIPVFFGLFFTCEMRQEIIEKLLPKYVKYASKRNRKLELMMHPGAVMDESELLDSTNKQLKEFYASELRECEYEALLNVKIVY